MPNRYIREGINASERVCTLDWGAECFYRRALLVVDDFGRFEFSRELKSRCYPIHDNVRMADVSRWFAACEKAGLIVCYDLERELRSAELAQGQKAWFAMPNTEEPRARFSKHPQPPQAVGVKYGLWRSCDCGKPKCSCSRLFTDVYTCTQPRSVPSTFPSNDNEYVPENGSEGRAGRRGFPSSIDDAIKQCELEAVPKEFVMTTWDKAEARGGKDAREIPIENFRSYVRTEWKYERERREKDRLLGKAPSSGPKPEHPNTVAARERMRKEQ